MPLDFILLHVCLLGLTVLLTQSLHLVWRVNLFSLGHHGYYAVGAYASVVVFKLVTGSHPNAWDVIANSAWSLPAVTIWLTCAVSGFVIAGGFALISFRVFGHLRGDYFAVATLIFAEIVKNVVFNWDFVGGGLGVEVSSLVINSGGETRLQNHLFYASVILGLNVLFYLGLRRLSASVCGLYIDATRNDLLAAELSGVDVGGLRRALFTLGCATAGLAGALFLLFQQLIIPNDFSFANGLPIILYVVLGRGRASHTVVAAIALYIVFELVKLRFLGLLGTSFGAFLSDWKEGLLALVLLFAVTGPVYWHHLVKSVEQFRRKNGHRHSPGGTG